MFLVFKSSLQPCTLAMLFTQRWQGDKLTHPPLFLMVDAQAYPPCGWCGNNRKKLGVKS